MRLTSDFWVSAYLRRRNAGGDAFAVVARRGAAEAGAVYVKIVGRDGAADLYGPAPQMMLDAEDPGERRFERLMTGVSEADIDARLAREMRFDPDLWLVEVEDRSGNADLPLAQ